MLARSATAATSSPLPSGSTTSVTSTSGTSDASARRSSAMLAAVVTRCPSRLSAAATTVRIALSSSTIRTEPGHDALGSRMRNTVTSGSRSRAYCTIPPMSRTSFSTRGQSQPLPFRLARDERLEQMLGDVGRRAGAIVGHEDFDRQRLARAARAGAHRHAVAIGGRQRDPRRGESRTAPRPRS
jgi:hypothetical protein